MNDQLINDIADRVLVKLAMEKEAIDINSMKKSIASLLAAGTLAAGGGHLTGNLAEWQNNIKAYQPANIALHGPGVNSPKDAARTSYMLASKAPKEIGDIAKLTNIARAKDAGEFKNAISDNSVENALQQYKGFYTEVNNNLNGGRHAK